MAQPRVLTLPEGSSEGRDTSTSGSDYARLSQLIRQAGLLARRPTFYSLRFAITIGLFAASWVAFAVVGDSWYQLIVAAIMGVLFTQVAFLGHDVGHRQVFNSKRAGETVGLLIGNLGVGMSYGWWIGKHTRHHANPNHEDHDPDIGVGPAIAWNAEQAALRKSRIGRAFAKWQAWFFFPLLTLEGLNLRYSSFSALGDKEVKRKGVEATLMIMHVVAYLGALLIVLPPSKAIAFFAIHQAIFGVYMGCSFAPGHKGMPILNEKIDFLRRQVLTSRNIRGHWFIDYLLGGLNYQIEHHLFPSMAMPNLRRAQPLIREFCADHGIPYHETGFIASYKEAIGSLHAAGAALRRRPQVAA